jgi:hypothetical protein
MLLEQEQIPCIRYKEKEEPPPAEKKTQREKTLHRIFEMSPSNVTVNT